MIIYKVQVLNTYMLFLKYIIMFPIHIILSLLKSEHITVTFIAGYWQALLYQADVLLNILLVNWFQNELNHIPLTPGRCISKNSLLVTSLVKLIIILAFPERINMNLSKLGGSDLYENILVCMFNAPKGEFVIWSTRLSSRLSACCWWVMLFDTLSIVIYDILPPNAFH